MAFISRLITTNPGYYAVGSLLKKSIAPSALHANANVVKFFSDDSSRASLHVSLPMKKSELRVSLESKMRKDTLTKIIDISVQESSLTIAEKDKIDSVLFSQLEANNNHISPGLHLLTRALRRSNLSMPLLRGQQIMAKVVQKSDGTMLLDPGFYNLSEIPENYLTTAQIVRKVDDSPRNGIYDVRAGDVVKVVIDDLYTPYGDMQLDVPKEDANIASLQVW
eukprot:CAMPEP_0175058212 /NCGR_PEP_ID=MMETSP0052_2-20121109/11721_1 /TAXON_ID=51329 ORGANISM="Polytomella parva, Strain SAG 63-3" /NCGR_SAMPLE_ID=MMETSP0052_2 /ASSEMBLY_ACC=CAM_ASM_000194 /LENGTH=221 /DNA_ID=CAMNT_0016323565 /DNA_START=26 /DNA_END=688 /DNA_ORIENTATION=+